MPVPMKYTFSRLAFLLGCLLLLHVAPLKAQQRRNNAKVKVVVKIDDRTRNDSLILYKRERPLVTGDFKGKPFSHTKGVAATYSGILMQIEGESLGDVLSVTVSLQVYFNRYKSWVKPAGRNERVLAHEQIHFDLTAIKACALARAIEQGSYTSENVKEQLHVLQTQHMADLQRLQDSYDLETQHGVIEEKQEEWALRISKGLSNQQCF
jgi:hypothetical protein